jgi:hypothetical protein
MSDPIRAALERLIKDTEYLAKGGEDLDRTWAAIAAGKAALAEEQGEGPPTVTIKSLLNPAYEITGEEIAEGAQLVDGEWWNPVMGCDSLQMVVDNARAAMPQGGVQQ